VYELVAMPQKLLTLTCKNVSTGEQVLVDAQPDESINLLKRQIEHRCGIPVRSFSLVFRGKVLRGFQTVRGVGLVQEPRLFLALHSSGGGGGGQRMPVRMGAAAAAAAAAGGGRRAFVSQSLKNLARKNQLFHDCLRAANSRSGVRAQEVCVVTLAKMCEAEKAQQCPEVVKSAGAHRNSVMLARRRSQYGPPSERPGLLVRKDSLINTLRFREQVRTAAHTATSIKRLAQPKTPKRPRRPKSAKHPLSRASSARPGSAASFRSTQSAPPTLVAPGRVPGGFRHTGRVGRGAADDG
jgi:hypothetical protein